ncbi:MAG: trypsin-like peptidase domain-containing protein [Gemmatimonadetes bacterium]|jgi:S1-C subfamily serine protease|nr:trypsin-like peptidase domain-containing protein [Gemmatimonadota bacterium]MBT6146525.1 trypsin-like peptidase domain-containing protein [Gemmatimonadota bacterium]MBT7863013.1 trypsin-like peptidase domain-containing protein [Gemmatimonadota bacterium]
MNSRTAMLISCVLTALSCTPPPRSPSAIDGLYDLAYPTYGDSEELEEILQSVRLLNASAQYTNYHFSLHDSVLATDITDDTITRHQISSNATGQSVVGTATTIFHGAGKLAVLTCAHVVDFPDTVFHFHRGPKGMATPYVREISIRQTQTNTLVDLRDAGDLEILAIDRDADIAILGKSMPPGADVLIPVFDNTLGRASELGWGTFVFVIGFPTGKKMITTGVISVSRRNDDQSFLLDMIFNRGFSGGIVLAVRDGLPNLELVGMVNAGAGESELVFTPEFQGVEGFLDSDVPYRRDLFLEQRRRLTYGISFGISTEAIRKMLHENRHELTERGYDVDAFFHQPAPVFSTP